MGKFPLRAHFLGLRAHCAETLRAFRAALSVDRRRARYITGFLGFAHAEESLVRGRRRR